MTERPRWGPDNPHPLSQLQPEFVWEGKYDEYGQRRVLEAASLAMPLRQVETIDGPATAAPAQRGSDNAANSRRDDFRNLLIRGDNKSVMASLLKDFKGRIDLIYIDPPFGVGADFTLDVNIGAGQTASGKAQAQLEVVAYQDTWGSGAASYLHMLYERLTLMKELLSETGSIYVHCDWRVNSYIRLILDEVFGRERHVNEIVWAYKSGGSTAHRFARKHDTIHFYAKGATPIFHASKEKSYNRSLKPYRFAGVPEFKDETGWHTLVNMRDVWQLDMVGRSSGERVAYATQKPEALLEVIIKASSNEDSLVADFFCGSGTTGAVAERLGRRWLMADLGRYAIHTSRKRMIALQRKLHAAAQPYRAFDVYDLGPHERQRWQQEHCKGAANAYRRVILDGYKAKPLPHPTELLHGRKGRAHVSVADINSNLTHAEVRAVAAAARLAGATEAHCLAWEFAPDLRSFCAELAAGEGVQLKLITIPREIMEQHCSATLPFREIAVLAAAPVIRGPKHERTVDIKLTHFLPPLAVAPNKERATLRKRGSTNGFDFIDFWAVDFDYAAGQPFKHHWQIYRTRQDRTLKTVSDAAYNKYPRAGVYTACVKVVDVFGYETSVLLPLAWH